MTAAAVGVGVGRMRDLSLNAQVNLSVNQGLRVNHPADPGDPNQQVGSLELQRGESASRGLIRAGGLL